MDKDTSVHGQTESQMDGVARHHVRRIYLLLENSHIEQSPLSTIENISDLLMTE